MLFWPSYSFLSFPKRYPVTFLSLDIVGHWPFLLERSHLTSPLLVYFVVYYHFIVQTNPMSRTDHSFYPNQHPHRGITTVTRE